MWHESVSFQKASVGQTHGWMLINRRVARMTWQSSVAPAEMRPTFWEHFTHRWDVPHAHEVAHNTHRQMHSHTTVHRKQTSDKQTQTSWQTLISVSRSARYTVLSSQSLSCFHIQTHSHSGGVIECDSKSWEGCWRVMGLTCEMEPTWHQQVGSDTYRHTVDSLQRRLEAKYSNFLCRGIFTFCE